MTLIWNVKLDTKKNIADILSRGQLEETTEEIIEENSKSQIHMVHENYPIVNGKMTKIRMKTSKDAALAQVSKYIINW